MKRFFTCGAVFLMILSCAGGKNIEYSADCAVKYGRAVTVSDYTLYEYSSWTANTDDARNYDVNLYFTRDHAKYLDSNSVIFFYYVEDEYKSLEDVVLTDKYNFLEKYPGIKIDDFDLGIIDFSVVCGEPVSGNYSEKSYMAVIYDYSNVKVRHDDQYQIVVFFKFNTGSPYFCVLELASTDDEALRYVDDLKKIFMAVSEDSAGSGENN